MQPIDASEKATAETQKKVPQEPAGYSDTQGIYIYVYIIRICIDIDIDCMKI